MDAKDKDHTTPLHLGCRKGNVDAIKLLLDHRALVETRDNMERDALIYASWAGCPWDKDIDNSSIISLLIETCGAKPPTTCHDLITPLMYAATCDNVESIRCLLQYDEAGINKLNSKGKSALYLAVEHHLVYDTNKEGIELLCGHGADVNVTVENILSLSTPLVYAAQRHDTEVMKILLLHGSGLHPELNDCIEVECAANLEQIYPNRLLLVAGVFVNKPWKHYFFEYHDV